MRDNHHHGPDDHPDTHHDHAADATLAELLDLDGEVLHSYWADVLTWVRRTATDTRRVLDLGAGSGVGTIALAQRFGGAEVIAVDISPEMLQRVRIKALDLGLADRIRTVQTDLDNDWPVIDPVDVTWASMSLHHLADPQRVLDQVFAATRAGGLLAVAEMSEPLRFLPHDLGLGRPGLEARCLAALDSDPAHPLSRFGSQWSPLLEAAGFAVLHERTFTIDLNPPHPPGAARYARGWLQRLMHGVGHRLADDDRETLATLIDSDGPESLLHRDDVHLQGTRTVTLARRA